MKERYIEDIDLSGKTGGSETVLGWVTSKRSHKGALFLDISDSTGNMQVVALRDKIGDRNYETLKALPVETAVKIEGTYQSSPKGGIELTLTSFEVKGRSSLGIHPRPREANFDPFDLRNGRQLLEHPSFYLRNPKLAAALKFKSRFRHNLGEFFWGEGFVQFEPPTLTTQTLYDDNDAFWIDINGQSVSLSRCATFHLEPAIIAYERVFAITDSHSREISCSGRHLAEYTHLKAEIAWANLDDLMTLASRTYFEVGERTAEDCRKEIGVLGIEESISRNLGKLNPKNQVTITYDEAVNILKKDGVDFEYGKSLSHSDEERLTKLLGENFTWVRYIPCSAEGFPFRKKPDAPHLTMTADLIAPRGYGEILGVAEKIINEDELLERMSEKGKSTPEQLKRYRDYVDLRRYGLPEHGGIGIGIERAVRYLLSLSHIKFTRPFPMIHGTRVNH